MPNSVAIALAGLLLTMIVGFARVIGMLARLELKVDTMWPWYLRVSQSAQRGGRRHTDPPWDDREG